MDPEPTTKQSSPKKILTDKAAVYLQAHFTEKFSLEEMASALYVNKHYLARTFKAVTGQTLLQYHNRLRCEKAAALLKNPHLSVTGIALRTGFTSPSHFSRIFKLYEGCTPSEYRKSHSI